MMHKLLKQTLAVKCPMCKHPMLVPERQACVQKNFATKTQLLNSRLNLERRHILGRRRSGRGTGEEGGDGSERNLTPAGSRQFVASCRRGLLIRLWPLLRPYTSAAGGWLVVRARTGTHHRQQYRTNNDLLAIDDGEDFPERTDRIGCAFGCDFWIGF